jgi:hypothetical protein
MPYHDIGTFIPGDLNLDFSANIGDVLYLVDYLFGGDTSISFWPPELVDMNGDGKRGNISDLTYLVSYLFLGGPPPHTPDEGIRPAPPYKERDSVISPEEQPPSLKQRPGRDSLRYISSFR